MRKLLRIFLYCLLISFAAVQLSFGEDEPIYSGGGKPTIFSGDRNRDDYDAQAFMDGMSHKFIRGLINIGTGFGELPKQMALTTKEEGAAWGNTVGFIKGLGMSIARTLVGVYDTAFFFVPLPGFYNPIMDPVYVWEKEE